MEQKLRALLGFARKAGKLALGTLATEESVNKHRSRLVLCASDISPKSIKEIRFLCEKHGVRVAVMTIGFDDVSVAIGKRAGILSVEDEGFANAIAENI